MSTNVQTRRSHAAAIQSEVSAGSLVLSDWITTGLELEGDESSQRGVVLTIEGHTVGSKTFHQSEVVLSLSDAIAIAQSLMRTAEEAFLRPGNWRP